MFSSFHYWWLALLVLLAFAGLNVVVRLLRNNPRLSYAIAYTIAVYLLIYKIGEYTVWQILGHVESLSGYNPAYQMKFPVEFSAMSYVVYSIFVTFRLKKIDAFAVFTAILAGVIYEISWIVSPDGHVGVSENHFLSVMAVINHTLLYFGGILLASNCRSFEVKKTVWQLLIGVAALIGYSWIIHLFTPYTDAMGKPIIIMITDGSVLSYVAKDPSVGLKIGYFIAAAILFSLIVAGFYFLNYKTSKERLKNGGPANFNPDTWLETYVWKKNASSSPDMAISDATITPIDGDDSPEE